MSAAVTLPLTDCFNTTRATMIGNLIPVTVSDEEPSVMANLAGFSVNDIAAKNTNNVESQEKRERVRVRVREKDP